MREVGENASLPQFLENQNASTALLSYHISLGQALRSSDLYNGEQLPNALSVTVDSPVKPLLARRCHVSVWRGPTAGLFFSQLLTCQEAPDEPAAPGSTRTGRRTRRGRVTAALFCEAGAAALAFIPPASGVQEPDHHKDPGGRVRGNRDAGGHPDVPRCAEAHHRGGSQWAEALRSLLRRFACCGGGLRPAATSRRGATFQQRLLRPAFSLWRWLTATSFLLAFLHRRFRAHRRHSSAAGFHRRVCRGTVAVRRWRRRWRRRCRARSVGLLDLKQLCW